MLHRWADSTFHSLRNPQFRMLWIGTTVAFLAFMMSSILQSVVAFDLTGKNGAVGIVGLGMGISTIIFSPFGGVFADRVSKKGFVLAGQAIIGLNFTAVGLLIAFDAINLWWLTGSTFVMGLVFSLIGPARIAWIGELLPRDSLPNAMALQNVAMSATRIAGPIIASVIIAIPLLGTGGAYFAMAGMLAFVVLTVFWLPATTRRKDATRTGIFTDMSLGFRHMVERPRLLVLALTFIGIVMTGFTYFVLLPGLLENEFNRGSEDIGILFAVNAAAGLVVSLALAGLAGSRSAMTVMTASGLVLGIGVIALGLAPGFLGAILAMLLVGGGWAGYQMLNNAIIMQEADPAYHGRVMSLVMIGWGVNGIAAYPFGALADKVGERETLVLMGVLSLLVVIAAAIAQPIAIRRSDNRRAVADMVAGGR